MKITVLHSKDAPVPGVYSGMDRRFILRDGRILEYDPGAWDPAEGEPQFVTVLAFPGN